MTQQDSYAQMGQVREHLLKFLHYHQHQLSYRKRFEIAVDIFQQIEAEGNYPQVSCTFDQFKSTFNESHQIHRETLG